MKLLLRGCQVLSVLPMLLAVSGFCQGNGEAERGFRCNVLLVLAFHARSGRKR
mgnify:CR=1 FL=1